MTGDQAAAAALRATDSTKEAQEKSEKIFLF